MEFSEEIISKAKQAASAEELRKLALEEGLELTAEEAEKVFGFLSGKTELTDEELEQVAGGVKFKYFSIEKCPDCGYWEFMPCNRQLHECPKCGSKNIRRVFGI